MLEYRKGHSYYLETTVIDSVGDFIDGLAITYEVRKSDDDTLYASGSMSDVGAAYKSLVAIPFPDLGQYRVVYFTPQGYENGLEGIIVIDEMSSVAAQEIADAVWDELLSGHSIDNSAGEKLGEALGQYDAGGSFVGGKGGGKTSGEGGKSGEIIVSDTGRKSPWTFKQKEDVRKTVARTHDLLTKMETQIKTDSKNLSKGQNEIKDLITLKLEVMRDVQNKLHNKHQIAIKQLSSGQEKSYKVLANRVDGLVNNLEKSKQDTKKDSKKNIDSIREELDKFYSIMVKSLNDDELENIVNEGD